MRRKLQVQKTILINDLRIGKNLNLQESLTLGIGRHTFATSLYYSGNKQFASEMMGHSSPIVTEHYFKSLQLNQLKMVSDTLLDFKKLKGGTRKTN